MILRECVLQEAKRCVVGDRDEDYGSPERSFEMISKLWSVYLGVDVKPYDVAAMMALLKVARIAGGHGKMDNWVDLAGYAACGGELERLAADDKDNSGLK